MMRNKPPRTVLVVDDESLIRWSLSEGLADAGWTVRQAATGNEARAAVRALEGQPFVLLLDLRLPDVSDLSLIRELRAARPDVPMIVMSAHGSSDDAMQAMACGAFSFVGKPFDMVEMVALVDAAVAI
ncbi:MAG TPA: response regulator [Vicinamibacterales bacterium]|nr:response regulator [Vicinamibacterales bacterium]